MLAMVFELCAGTAGGRVKLVFFSSLSPRVLTVFPSSDPPPFALTSISVQVAQASAQTSLNGLPSRRASSRCACCSVFLNCCSVRIGGNSRFSDRICVCTKSNSKSEGSCVVSGREVGFVRCSSRGSGGLDVKEGLPNDMASIHIKNYMSRCYDVNTSQTNRLKISYNGQTLQPSHCSIQPNASSRHSLCLNGSHH